MLESLMLKLQAMPVDANLVLVLLTLLVIIGFLLFLFMPSLKEWHQERLIRSTLRRLGARSMRDLCLPDGTGDEVTIDHLLLTREAILVLGVKRFDGLIFGAGHTDQWTQVLNRVSYKFENPDNYLQRQMNAVRQLVPGIAVQGVHLFTHGAKFPRDKPANVMLLGDSRSLPRRPRMNEIPDRLRQAWDRLASL